MILINKLLKCEKGQSMVLFPFILLVLIGICALVTDVGMLYVEKAQLQTSVDAAALAGGQELPAKPGEAMNIAYDYADNNGKVGDEVTPTVTSDNRSLTVSALRHAPLYFARIFGMNTSDITATASVTLTPPGNASNVIPLGVEKKTFQYGESYTLKVGGGDGYTGNYGPLALGGTGADVYRENLKNGYSGIVNYGQTFDVDTEPGNKKGVTDSAINYRINQDPTATFTTVQKGSPRIVTIPIVESITVNGRKLVQVVSFAVFFLQSSNQGEVTGVFMEMVVASSTSGSGPSYGAYYVKLTQ